MYLTETTLCAFMQDKQGGGHILHRAAQNFIQENLHDRNSYIGNTLKLRVV